MVHGLPQVQFLEGDFLRFSLGKHPEKLFNKGNSWREQCVLELVHSDVVGPFPVPSFGKSHYALTFIDDYSFYTWVFFMAHKSEVFEQFLTFKAQVEK